MKIKDGYILKDVAGSKIVIATGTAKIDFNGVMTFNEVGADIFNLLNGENTAEDIISKITADYDVKKERAEADFNAFICKLREHNLLDE